MAELGVAQKTEVGAALKPTGEIRIDGRLEHQDILKLVKEIDKPLSDDEFAKRLTSIAKKPIVYPTETNSSAMKVEKTSMAIVKTNTPEEKMPIAPQRPKTKEELKADKREAERLANLAAKRQREQWNRENRLGR